MMQKYSTDPSLLKGSKPRDDWHREHQGPFIRVIGYVWECGDDYCSCSRSVIVEQYRNTSDSRWIVPIGIWEGTFYTDGETGANDELIAKRTELRKSEPEYANLIEWSIWHDPEVNDA